VGFDLMVRILPKIFLVSMSPLSFQEVNPSLSDQNSVEQTVSVGRSLIRSALGTFLSHTKISS
jgi:hypothetical protein